MNNIWSLFLSDCHNCKKEAIEARYEYCLALPSATTLDESRILERILTDRLASILEAHTKGEHMQSAWTDATEVKKEIGRLPTRVDGEQAGKQLRFLIDIDGRIKEIGRLWLNKRGNLEFSGDLEKAISVVFIYLKEKLVGLDDGGSRH